MKAGSRHLAVYASVFKQHAGPPIIAPHCSAWCSLSSTCCAPPASLTNQSLRCSVSRVCIPLQRMVLYSFPAICWAYGAGALFSSFVSVVFWTG